MQTYSITYSEELHVNQWGTERVNARFVNGKKFAGYTTDDLPEWFKQIIQRNLKKQGLELVFKKTKETTIVPENLSLKVSSSKYYMSQEVTLTIRTSKDLTWII